MTDAPRESGQSGAHAPLGRWSPAAVLLVALGAVLAIGGVAGALIVATSAARLSQDGAPRTLPVFVYTQYTQRLVAPDYTGLWIGVAVAAIGAIAVVAGIVLTRQRMSARPGH
ncbi:hypothetical protein ACFVU2_04000 [Leifsonia sp. NPDC058194]|uniref:hypothetical protein n=1 Tax=Leifsonia sp. NPDC058194 TaxID=3346374 RepID=UPI0036DD1635